MARSRRSVSLSAEDRAVYEWQLDVAGFGDAGQKGLKAASVLVTRVGGVGGSAALGLAAAGIGRLLIAHHGNVKPGDLNRQTLMRADAIGKPRVEVAYRRLKEFNPKLVVETVAQNVTPENVQDLVGSVDLVIDAAPIFPERFLLNRECVRQNKPMVDSAMYELEAQLTTILPGKTPCLACLYPGEPPGWKRRFPVFGAVAGMIGQLAAMEAIKVLTGLGEPLLGRLLVADLRDMSFRTLKLQRNLHCAECRDRKDGR